MKSELSILKVDDEGNLVSKLKKERTPREVWHNSDMGR